MKKLGAVPPQQEDVNNYFQDVSSYWKDVYSVGGVQAEIIRDRHVAILEWIDDLALAPGSRVLEIGCGAGFMAIELARRGFRVHAVDSAEAMIGLARGHAIEAGTVDTPSFDVGDVHSLAFDDSFFDLVIAIGVIPWLERPETAMREMARVAKPGGHVLLTSANRAGLASLLDPLINPLLQPLKLKVKNVFVDLGLRRQMPNMIFHSNRNIDMFLGGIGLAKVRGMTRGFGFSFLRHSVFPEPLATEVNRRLQQLADRKTFGFRSIGMAYVVLARKFRSSALQACVWILYGFDEFGFDEFLCDSLFCDTLTSVI